MLFLLILFHCWPYSRHLFWTQFFLRFLDYRRLLFPFWRAKRPRRHSLLQSPRNRRLHQPRHFYPTRPCTLPHFRLHFSWRHHQPIAGSLFYHYPTCPASYCSHFQKTQSPRQIPRPTFRLPLRSNRRHRQSHFCQHQLR